MTTIAAPVLAPEAATRAAQVFHALSDPARLEIIQILLDGEHCVCDLQAHTEAAQSRLSYHLKVLKDAGLVTDRREGRWSHYTLQREAFVDAESLLASLRPKGSRYLAVASCC